MKPCSWGARAAIALAAVGGAAPACAGSGRGSSRAAATVDAPVVPLTDASPAGHDAHWVEVDAATFRGKTVAGRLAPAKIQHVVRENFGSFRMCYESGLRASPNVQGRVTVKFVIDTDGRVTSAVDHGSDLADQRVVQCVVDEVRKLRFPKPEGGIVTVVYPIVFSPGD